MLGRVRKTDVVRDRCVSSDNLTHLDTARESSIGGTGANYYTRHIRQQHAVDAIDDAPRYRDIDG